MTNSMRLLKLCEEVKQMLIDDMITSGHARALLAVDDPEIQHQLAIQIFDEKLSVRDVEKLVKNLNRKVKEKKEEKNTYEFIYKDIENKISASLGTKVSITSKNNEKGKIEINYFSNDELDRIVELITS